MEKETEEKQELEENEKEIELEKDDVERVKEENKPIKISLKKLLLIICGIIVLVVCIGLVIYFIYENTNTSTTEDINYYKTLKRNNIGQSNTEYDSYLLYAPVVFYGNLFDGYYDDSVLDSLSISNIEILDNTLITSYEGLTEIKMKLEGYESYYEEELEILEMFDEAYFENNNLAVCNIVVLGENLNIEGVNIEEEKANINISFLKSDDEFILLCPYLSIITLDKDVTEVNYNIYTIVTLEEIIEKMLILVGCICIIIIVLVIIRFIKFKCINRKNNN